MNVLADRELVDFIDQGHIKLGEIKVPKDWYEKDSPVQPASVDLHIGNIFLPESSVDSANGGIRAIKNYILKPGETVLVEVEEELEIPANYAGFGFPPASVAVQGLLMTNPGHIDPGFKGRLKFTLINMGKKELQIRNGDVIFSTIWVKLHMEVERDYLKRRPEYKYIGPNEQNLSVLNKDFLNIDRRARNTAREVSKRFFKKTEDLVRKTNIHAGIIAVVFSIVTFLGSYFLTGFHEERKNIIQNEKDIASLKATMETKSNKEIDDLRNSIGKIQHELNVINKYISASKVKP